MYDQTIRDAVSCKGVKRFIKWRVYRKEWDWAYYNMMKTLNPVAARGVLLEYFTSRDTDGVMGKHVARRG